MIYKIMRSKYFIQYFHPYIGIGVPVAMEEYAAGGFEDAVQLLDAFFEPINVMVHAAAPAVLKTADFAFVAPYDFVVAVGEEGGIEVDEVYHFTIKLFEDFEVVAEIKMVHETEFIYQK
jgi:hypothetical protein